MASTFASDVNLGDLQFEHRPYDGMAAYAQSKACDRMLTWAFARRLEGDSITVNAMAPGLMLGTNLYRDLPPEGKRGLEQFGGRSVSEGPTRSSGWQAAQTWDGVCTMCPKRLRPSGARRGHDLVGDPVGRHCVTADSPTPRAQPVRPPASAPPTACDARHTTWSRTSRRSRPVTSAPPVRSWPSTSPFRGLESDRGQRLLGGSDMGAAPPERLRHVAPSGEDGDEVWPVYEFELTQALTPPPRAAAESR